MIIFVYYQDKFNILLENGKRFWKTDLCNDKVKVELDNLSAIIQRLQKLFFFCILFCIFMMILHGLMETGQLPLGVWTTNKYKYLYESSLITQVIMLPFMGCFVGAFDCIYLVFCTETIIQFKILKYCLINLKTSDDATEMEISKYKIDLKICIQQHNFLLG